MAAESILVVDDNPVNLKLIEFILHKRGYVVHTAKSGVEALDIVARTPVVLALLDIQMPGMDGIELARRLRANPSSSHLPLVAVTSHAMPADEPKIRAEGFDGYLSKPIDRLELRDLVERLIEAASKGAARSTPDPR